MARSSSNPLIIDFCLYAWKEWVAAVSTIVVWGSPIRNAGMQISHETLYKQSRTYFLSNF